MRADVVLSHGDLKREVWSLSLSVSPSGAQIHLDNYFLQTRPTTRHRNWNGKDSHADTSGISYAGFPLLGVNSI